MSPTAFLGLVVLACCAALGWGASVYLPTPAAVAVGALALLLAIKVRP